MGERGVKSVILVLDGEEIYNSLEQPPLPGGDVRFAIPARSGHVKFDIIVTDLDDNRITTSYWYEVSGGYIKSIQRYDNCVRLEAPDIHYKIDREPPRVFTFISRKRYELLKELDQR